MFRIFALLLLLAIGTGRAPLTLAAPPETASAAVSVSPSQMTLAPGVSGTVSIVAVVAGGNLGAWTIDVGYDPLAVGASACAATVPGALSLCNKDLPNAVRIVGVSAGGLSGTVTLGTISFQAIGGAGLGSPVHPVITEMTDTAIPAQAVAATVTDGAITITVAGALPGDIVADCAVNILDFSVLLTTFGKSPGQAGYDARADLSGNGTIDILDFSILLKYFGTRC